MDTFAEITGSAMETPAPPKVYTYSDANNVDLQRF